MPSRRAVLRAFGTAGAAAVAGCQQGGSEQTGRVTRRTAEVEVGADDDTAWRTVATATFDPVDASLRVEYNSEYATVDEAAAALVVADHDRLAEQFRDARYGLTVRPSDRNRVVRAAAEPADFRQVVAGETIAFVSYVEDAGTESVGVERDDGRELAVASLTTRTVDANG